MMCRRPDLDFKLDDGDNADLQTEQWSCWMMWFIPHRFTYPAPERGNYPL